MLHTATPAPSPVRATQGIPTFCASGDDGARDNDQGLNVDYPASSPHSFGCGGTTITLNDLDTEIGWTGAGGGISRVYKLPPWQVTPSLRSCSLCLAVQQLRVPLAARRE